MIIFSEDTEIARSSPAMISLYSASLLEVGKFRRMARSMTSVGRLPSIVKHHLDSKSTSQSCLVPFLVEESLLRSRLVLIPSAPDGV